jgi:DNA-binding CsgD family transcriptional regulator
MFPSHSLAPEQRGLLLAAEREGAPFLAFRGGDGDLRVLLLADRDRASIGRGEHNALVLAWDPEVSRTHAQLELIVGDWTMLDDGLSRNGSFVNDQRLTGRRRLIDGDVLRVGRTSMLYRSPDPQVDTTVFGEATPAVHLSDAQRRVLIALCRPFATGGVGMPATNRQISEELHLSVDGVKTHIRALFTKLDIQDLPQYQKRTELARRALDLGLVGLRDL